MDKTVTEDIHRSANVNNINSDVSSKKTITDMTEN